MAKRKLIGEDEIRRMPLSILVDTGFYYLCINETIQQQLEISCIIKR